MNRKQMTQLVMSKALTEQRGVQKYTSESPLYRLHPELAQRVPVWAYELHDGNISALVGLYHVNLSTWRDNTWVNRAISILSQSLASVPVGVQETRGESQIWLNDHFITHLVQFPNKATPASLYWTAWTADMMLGGEAGAELVRNRKNTEWVEMWHRQPTHFLVTPDTSKGGQRYQAVNGYVINDNLADPYGVDPTDFIHYKFFNPFQPFRGISPLTAIRLGVQIDTLSQAWTVDFLKNSARPDLAIIAPEGMTADEKWELKQDFRDQMAGQHDIVVLEGGVQDIKPFTMTTPDEDWIKQREFTRDQIAAIFGVPDEVMGYGRNTYENFDAAHRVLWTTTLVPLIDFRDQWLTHHMRIHGVLKPNQRVVSDLTDIPELKEDLANLISLAKDLKDLGYPINQINERLELGMKDVPWGNVAWMPFSVVPIDQNYSAQERSQDNQTQLAANGQTQKSNKALDDPVSMYGSQAHMNFWKMKQSRITQPVNAMKPQLKKFFQSQQIRVGQALRAVEQRTYGRAHYVGKGPDDIPNPEQIFNYTEEVERFKAEFRDLILQSFGAIAMVEFEDLPTEVIGSLLDVSRPEAQAVVEQILNTVAMKTTDTTWTGLISLFQEAEAAGETIPQIQERLSQFFGDRKSDYQTERIARTTMTGVDNGASKEAWKQSNVVKGSFWVSALLPNRTRASHAEAHGQERQLGAAFEVDGEALEFPGDPNGSPGNIINCLCTEKPIIIDVPESEEF